MERIDPYLVEIENVTKERDEALDTIDDMVDTIAKGIINIAHQNDDFVCTCCLGTARRLFRLMKKYAREEDTERIRAEWKHITGRDIE
jgi:hypothetical protein